MYLCKQQTTVVCGSLCHESQQRFQISLLVQSCKKGYYYCNRLVLSLNLTPSLLRYRYIVFCLERDNILYVTYVSLHLTVRCNERLFGKYIKFFIMKSSKCSLAFFISIAYLGDIDFALIAKPVGNVKKRCVQ